MNALSDLLPKLGQPSTSTELATPTGGGVPDVRRMELTRELGRAVAEAATRLASAAGYVLIIRGAEVIQRDAVARVGALGPPISTPAADHGLASQ